MISTVQPTMVHTRIRIMLGPRPLEAGELIAGADIEDVTPMLDVFDDKAKDWEGDDATGAGPEARGTEDSAETPEAEDTPPPQKPENQFIFASVSAELRRCVTFDCSDAIRIVQHICFVVY